MSLTETIRTILSRKAIHTQEELRAILEADGISVNQSTVSRAIHKLGVVRVSERGEKVYRLPDWDAPPSIETSLAELLLSIEFNEHMIVIRTKPGSASLIARHVDHRVQDYVLGTLAGDDTIFITPRAGVSLDETCLAIRRSLRIDN